MPASPTSTYGHSLDAGFTTLRLVPRAPVDSVQYMFEQAFNKGEECDLTVTARFEELKVHRNIVCLASKVLKQALNSDFKEAIKKRLDMSHCGHRVACAFIQYCYQRYYDTIECGSPELLRDGSLQDYDGLIRVNANLVWTASIADVNTAKNVANESNKRRLHLDVEMWRLGDMYDVPSLRSQAAHRLESRLYEHSCAKGSPAPLLDIIAPVYEYTGSDRNVLRRLLLRGLRSFKRSIHQDEAARATLQTLRETVGGFDAAAQRIFAGPPTNWRDQSFGWPSRGLYH